MFELVLRHVLNCCKIHHILLNDSSPVPFLTGMGNLQLFILPDRVYKINYAPRAKLTLIDLGSRVDSFHLERGTCVPRLCIGEKYPLMS